VLAYLNNEVNFIRAYGKRKVDLWLEGQMPEALKLQRPSSDAALKIVAKGEKEDKAPEAA
jgi:hypothetical protein